LLTLTLLPDRRGELPSAVIELLNADVLLMPAADPGALWTFSAPAARFDPDRDTTELEGVDDGARWIDGEIDFTLRSPLIVIDRRDDLITEQLDAHLIADGWDVRMEGRAGRNVLVRQETGRFEAPHVEMSGDGIGESIYQDMRITFDFTDFQSGGPGTVGTSAFISDRLAGNTPADPTSHEE
jgi:hypothetical protein